VEGVSWYEEEAVVGVWRPQEARGGSVGHCYLLRFPRIGTMIGLVGGICLRWGRLEVGEIFRLCNVFNGEFHRRSLGCYGVWILGYDSLFSRFGCWNDWESILDWMENDIRVVYVGEVAKCKS